MCLSLLSFFSTQASQVHASLLLSNSCLAPSFPNPTSLARHGVEPSMHCLPCLLYSPHVTAPLREQVYRELTAVGGAGLAGAQGARAPRRWGSGGSRREGRETERMNCNNPMAGGWGAGGGMRMQWSTSLAQPLHERRRSRRKLPLRGRQPDVFLGGRLQGCPPRGVNLV